MNPKDQPILKLQINLEFSKIQYNGIISPDTDQLGHTTQHIVFFFNSLHFLRSYYMLNSLNFEPYINCCRKSLLVTL